MMTRGRRLSDEGAVVVCAPVVVDGHCVVGGVGCVRCVAGRRRNGRQKKKARCRQLAHARSKVVGLS
jgi:hypothetical protein